MNRYIVKQDILSGYWQLIDREKDCVMNVFEWPGDAKRTAKYLNKCHSEDNN